jgi:prepilin-type N-terminal cleavage/methylation domain-containing protein
MQHTNNNRPRRGDAGMTLTELMMAIAIFAIVMIVINSAFFSTNRLYGSTTIRAGQQMNVRAGLSVMVSELRTAGCDGSQAGIVGVLAASGDSCHVQSDFSGDGVIQTAEPSETVLYYYEPGQLAVMRDPGTGPQVMLTNVTAFDLVFFDEANQVLVEPLTAAQRALIRSIQINITTQTPRGGDVTASTRVAFRNG